MRDNISQLITDKNEQPLKQEAPVKSIDKKSPKVALTFDDGPHESATPDVLRLLREKNIKATFFVCGNNAAKYPGILRKISDEGHIIGNHSYDHKDFIKLSAQEIEQEIVQTSSIIYDVIGKYPKLFRYPYGSGNDFSDKIITKKGLSIIGWTSDTQDWQKKVTAPVILSTVKNQIKPNGIILLHDRTALKSLPEIIDYLTNEGYRFVTIDELNDCPAYK